MEAIARGEIVIAMDAEDRENEGDFICAAEKVTPAIINFMITHGRGQLCMPLLPDVCQRLDLPPMVEDNTAPLRHEFHGARRSSQLPHGHYRPGAGRHDPGHRRSGEQADRFRPPGAPVSADGQGRRRASPGRPYRGRRRSGPHGRAAAGRRALRNPRRRRPPRHAATNSMPWPSSTTWRSSPSSN